MTTAPDPHAETHAVIDSLLADIARAARIHDCNNYTNRDGIPWHDAPLPRRWHRCRTHSSGVMPSGIFVERCPCGAYRIDRSGPWTNRNRRRKQR